jgi:uncharacterized protein
MHDPQDNNRAGDEFRPDPRAATVMFGGQAFELLPQRAMWWRSASTLLIADPHLGKNAVFSARGVPVPDDVTGDDLGRLTALLSVYRPRRLMVLGDLFHAKESNGGSTIRRLESWRDRHAEMEVVVVRGNHDRHAGDPPLSLRMSCVDDHVESGVCFAHGDGMGFETPGRRALNQTEARSRAKTSATQQKASATRPATLPTVCGHIHPGVRLSDFDGSGLTVPGFVVDPSRLWLPAFGRFTGSAAVGNMRGRRLFAAAGGRVIEVTAAV